jgi:hypothetical protein
MHCGYYGSCRILFFLLKLIFLMQILEKANNSTKEKSLLNMKMKIQYLSLSILLVLINTSLSTADCNIFLTEIQICNDFTSWSELNNQFSATPSNSQFLFISYLHPSVPIILTSDINMTYLTLHLNALESLNMYGLKGMNVFPWPVIPLYNDSQFDLVISVSTIEFYVNYKPTSEYTCNKGLVETNSTTSSFFSYINNLHSFKSRKHVP